jgi:hypothetical protein
VPQGHSGLQAINTLEAAGPPHFSHLIEGLTGPATGQPCHAGDGLESRQDAEPLGHGEGPAVARLDEQSFHECLGVAAVHGCVDRCPLEAMEVGPSLPIRVCLGSLRLAQHLR